MVMLKIPVGSLERSSITRLIPSSSTPTTRRGGQPSNQTLAPNGSAGSSTGWSGSSATSVYGNFAWYIVGQPEQDYLNVYWNVPWIGSNNIGDKVYYPLQCVQSGDTSGWHPNITWTVSNVSNS